jgi:hypothetical protein
VPDARVEALVDLLVAKNLNYIGVTPFDLDDEEDEDEDQDDEVEVDEDD